jgi:ABC-type dipeptide/oligopeptide/nickel transport system permease component
MRGGAFGWLARKTFLALAAAIGACLLVSCFLHLIPGDPVDSLLGEQASIVDRDTLRRCIGFNDPTQNERWASASVPLRAVIWLQAVGREAAQFGAQLASLSLRTSVPPCRELVLPRIRHALPRTGLLALAALIVAVGIGLPLGVLGAARRGTGLDLATTAFAVAGASVPRFWLGPVLILAFAIWLDWLPVSGFGSFGHVILPAVTLGTALAALLSRITRASMLDVLGEEYVVAARARGLPEWKLLAKHALRNAMLPVVTVLGLELGALLGGAVITEKVFAWPGMGMLLLTAIERRDYNTVRACVLVFTLIYVVVNLATDLVYAAIDPRIRKES